jgi:3-deoxy-D-arabino-heptulosonate 7-phosphate (DAHP) synthase class II
VADLLPKTHHLRRICRRVEESLTFMRALGMAEAYIPQSRTHFFTAHECLLLPYEQGLTRWHESRADWWSRDYYGRSAADRGAGEGIGRWYAGSAHMLWAGERTRHPDSAHMHFLSGVANPVGLKVRGVLLIFLHCFCTHGDDYPHVCLSSATASISGIRALSASGSVASTGRAEPA